MRFFNKDINNKLAIFFIEDIIIAYRHHHCVETSPLRRDIINFKGFFQKKSHQLRSFRIKLSETYREVLKHMFFIHQRYIFI